MKIVAPAWLSALILVLASALPAAAQDTYRVRAGDVLRVEVIEDPGLNRSVLVSPDGRISIPLAGSIQAAGRPLEAIQSDLQSQLASNFATPPSVFVGVERLAEPPAPVPQVVAPPAAPPTIDVFVLGEAGSPGQLQLEPGTNLLQAFASMGGFSRFAATQRIQLRRRDAGGNETVYVINYDAIEAGLSQNGMVQLQDGDVIVVPERRLFE